MIYPSSLDFFGISPSSPYHFTHTEPFCELNILFLGGRCALKEIIVNMGFGLSNNLFRLQCRMCHVSLLTSKGYSRCRTVHRDSFSPPGVRVRDAVRVPAPKLDR